MVVVCSRARALIGQCVHVVVGARAMIGQCVHVVVGARAESVVARILFRSR